MTDIEVARCGGDGSWYATYRRPDGTHYRTLNTHTGEQGPPEDISTQPNMTPAGLADMAEIRTNAPRVKFTLPRRPDDGPQ